MTRQSRVESNLPPGMLPPELEENLRAMNPWWAGQPMAPLPPMRRWPFDRLLGMIDTGLTPAVALRGPRRVGKTILVRQLIQCLLDRGADPRSILYVAFDELPTLRGIAEPVLAIARWFEQGIRGMTFNEAAHRRAQTLLFLDEVQNLDAWAPQIKNLVDNQAVRVLITGSSSLRIEAGRDSLAGRILSLDMGPLLLREVAALRSGYASEAYWKDNGLDALATPDFWIGAAEHARRSKEPRLAAFRSYSDRGGYPLAEERADVPWHEIAYYLNETVIRRAIRHDLRMRERGRRRDENLLEEVFRACCRYAGQTPGRSVLVPDMQEALGAGIGFNRILNYLRFLDGTLLIKLVKPHELRLKRKKSPDKVCLCDHALRASWLGEVVPLDAEGLQANPHLTDIAGHLAESTLGYYLGSVPGLDVTHFPSRGAEPEVDFVLTVGTRRVPIEVKYRKRIDPHDDTRGLRAFLEKTVYNAPFGLLVTLDDDVAVRDPRIISLSLSALLWMR